MHRRSRPEDGLFLSGQKVSSSKATYHAFTKDEKTEAININDETNNDQNYYNYSESVDCTSHVHDGSSDHIYKVVADYENHYFSSSE